MNEGHATHAEASVLKNWDQCQKSPIKTSYKYELLFIFTCNAGVEVFDTSMIVNCQPVCMSPGMFLSCFGEIMYWSFTLFWNDVSNTDEVHIRCETILFNQFPTRKTSCFSNYIQCNWVNFLFDFWLKLHIPNCFYDVISFFICQRQMLLYQQYQ